MKNFIILLLSGILIFNVAATKVLAQKPDTKVTMGIHLDYFFSGDDGGIKAKSVSAGKAAEKAGVHANDIILAIDDTKIKGLFHYRDMLNTYKKGQQVKLKVKRANKIVYLDLTF